MVGYGLKITHMKMEQPLALHCQLQSNISIQSFKLVLSIHPILFTFVNKMYKPANVVAGFESQLEN